MNKKILKLNKIEVERYKTLIETEKNKEEESIDKDFEKEIEELHTNKGKVEINEKSNKYLIIYESLKSGLSIEDCLKNETEKFKICKNILTITNDKKIKKSLENFMEGLMINKDKSLQLTF